MGITRFLKMKTRLPLVLAFFWGFYFFFSPFLHFHPSDVHAHGDELQAHHHDGHFHSHELETLAHVWNFHPADEDQDEKHHQSHSSPEHDSDNSEVSLNSAGLKAKNLTEVSKHKGNVSYFSIPQLSSHQVKEILPTEFLSVKALNIFNERSPPYFFV